MENQDIIINPDKNQLKSSFGIIYYIKNKITNQYYIGQTQKNFYKRYPGGWWKSSSNEYLLNSSKKYGKDNFELAILARGINFVNKLNELEDYFSKVYDSYWPNGFNFAPCGRGYDRNGSPSYFDKLGKDINIKNIFTNELISTKNMSKFCRDRNISFDAFYDNISKPGHITKDGYTHIDTKECDINNRYFYTRRPELRPPFTLYKDGAPYVFDDVSKFCKTNNIKSPSKILNVLEGKSVHCSRYTKENIILYKNFQKYKNIKLINKNNEISEYADSTDFENKTGLDHKKILKLITGKCKKSAGYKLVSFELI